MGKQKQEHEQKQKRKRRKLHEISIEEDTRYRGPLSYQSFQALGWLCIVLTAVLVVLRIAGKADPEFANSNEKLMNTLVFFSQLSLPFSLLL